MIQLYKTDMKFMQTALLLAAALLHTAYAEKDPIPNWHPHAARRRQERYRFYVFIFYYLEEVVN